MLLRASFYDLYDVYKHYGPDPVMMLLVDGVDDLKWTVFGKIKNLRGSHDHRLYTPTTFDVLEVV